MKFVSGNPYIIKENNDILIDSLSFNNELKDLKTPYMLFIDNRVRDNINTFKRAVRSVFKKTDLFYSLKANYVKEICEIIKDENLGAEIVGLPELDIALKLNFDPNKIIIGGPYNSTELIKKSIDNDLKEIIVYSLEDLEKINKYAKGKNKIQKVCLRINSQKYESKLGIDLNDINLQKLQNISKKCRNINITTILSHFSSQMNNEEHFKKNANSINDALEKLLNIDVKIQNINFGGGFPEAVVMPADRLVSILKIINLTLKINDFNIENIYFEPGRYIVGDAGLFIGKITDIKEGRWILLNIGNNICPKFARCTLRFYNASRINESHKFKTNIAGTIPTDQDILAKNYYFTEKLNRNDRVLITNVGAYCLTFSNRFPYHLPQIFIIKDGNIRRIFNPEQNRDFFF